MNQIRRVGVVVNHDKPAALDFAREAIYYLMDLGVTLRLQKTIAEYARFEELTASDHDVCSSDVVIVFGGDGTLLRASRLCAPLGSPMLGINLGRFGFLNEIAPELLYPTLDRLVNGEYTIEERLMLETQILKNGEIESTDMALNEIVIAHGSLARVVRLSLCINDKPLASYSADGIIISTPTGSTAYSLSAGELLVHPSIPTMVITPICPHSLTSRALLAPDDAVLSLIIESSNDDVIQVTIDGQRGYQLCNCDKIIIKRSNTPARLVTNIGGDSFYQKLQSKLHWSESLIY